MLSQNSNWKQIYLPSVSTTDRVLIWSSSDKLGPLTNSQRNVTNLLNVQIQEVKPHEASG